MSIDFEAAAQRLDKAVSHNRRLGQSQAEPIAVSAADLQLLLLERSTLLIANTMQGDTITALDAELVRAGRLIDAMSDYIAKMALPAERLADLNEFWLFMERRKRATG